MHKPVKFSNTSTPTLRRRSPAKFSCLLLMVIACLLTSVAETETIDSAAKLEHIDLSPATVTHRVVPAGAKDVFRISLTAGDLLRLSIDKGDFALSITIYDPSRQKFHEQISYGYELPELALPVVHSGQYLLEINSLELNDTSRRYELRVEPLKPATPADHRSVIAQRAAANASILRADWTEKALLQAVERYDDAARVWQSLHDSRRAALATMDAAEVNLLLGQYREALQRYQRAAAQAKKGGARLETSKALGEVGRLYSYLGDNDQAQAYVSRALTLLPINDQPNHNSLAKITHARNLHNLGEVSYSKGNLLKSLKVFENALKIFDEVGDRTGAAQAHLFLGYITGSLGDPEKAVAEINEALRLFRATRHKTGEGLCLSVLGLARSNRNDGQAMSFHHEALEIFRKVGDRQSEAIAINGLGQAYQYINQHSTALAQYQKALNLFLDNGNLDFAAETSLSVARVYRLLGDREQALAYAEKGLELSRSAKKVRTQANALNEVAVSYSAQGNHEKAIQQYQKILKFYASISDIREQATTWNNLGDVYFRSGKKQEALKSYQRASSLSKQTGDKAVLISSLYNIAVTQRDRANFDLALDSIEESIKIIEDLRTNVASSDFRISYFSGMRKHYDLCMAILMQLHSQRPNQRYDAAAFLMSERARARSLNDILTEVPANIPQGVAPELLAREHHLRSLIRAQAEYQMALSISGKDPSEEQEIARQVDQLKSEYEMIKAQIRMETPNLSGFYQLNLLSVDQIQAELRDGNTVLLEYALGDERSYLWAVTADSLRSYELPSRSNLEDASREIYQLLIARQQIDETIPADYQGNVETADRAYHNKVLKLSQLLLGPVADELGTKRIVIAAEGMLQYIPFDALPSPHSESRGRIPGTVNTEDSLLIDTNEIVMLPSVSTLAAIRRQKRTAVSSEKLVAIFADPVFNTSDDRVRSRPGSADIMSSDSEQEFSRVALRALARNRGPQRLVHSSREADAIVATAPRGTTVVNRAFEANREAVMMPALGDYQIIHFATHGFFNNEHPELSGIVMSMVEPDGSKVNGFMSLHDIYQLNLSAQLVVLSACETALGKDVKGEGLISLTRGFMHAGSSSVVTSLWKVDDRATAKLMKHFYEFMLRDGMTPSAALRSAKQKIRKESAWEAPFFWAGFTLHGEYKERIVTPRDASSRDVLLASLALIFISAGVIFLQRRRRARQPFTLA